jgi:hypothetical protein
MKRLDLHPFAKRIARIGNELTCAGLAVGSNIQLTAFDTAEQLLWTSNENIFFSCIKSSELSVFKIDAASQTAAPFINNLKDSAHTNWQIDFELLKIVEDATVVLRCLTPYALSWGKFALKNSNFKKLPPNFQTFFVSDFNDKRSLIHTIQDAELRKNATLCIFTDDEAPILMSSSFEAAFSQLYHLETLCKSSILLGE